MDFGAGQLWIADVLIGSTEILVGEMRNPRNATDVRYF